MMIRLKKVLCAFGLLCMSIALGENEIQNFVQACQSISKSDEYTIEKQQEIKRNLSDLLKKYKLFTLQAARIIEELDFKTQDAAIYWLEKPNIEKFFDNKIEKSDKNPVMSFKVALIKAVLEEGINFLQEEDLEKDMNIHTLLARDLEVLNQVSKELGITQYDGKDYITFNKRLIDYVIKNKLQSENYKKLNEKTRLAFAEKPWLWLAILENKADLKMVQDFNKNQLEGLLSYFETAKENNETEKDYKDRLTKNLNNILPVINKITQGYFDYSKSFIWQ